MKLLSACALEYIKKNPFDSTQGTEHFFINERHRISIRLHIEDNCIKQISTNPDASQLLKAFLAGIYFILGKQPLNKIQLLSVREIEAFLRDKNSLPSFELTSIEWEDLELLLNFVKEKIVLTLMNTYSSIDKTWSELGLVEKVQMVKSFIHQPRWMIQDNQYPLLVDIHEDEIYLDVGLTDKSLSQFLDIFQSEICKYFSYDFINVIPEVAGE